MYSKCVKDGLPVQEHSTQTLHSDYNNNTSKIPVHIRNDRVHINNRKNDDSVLRSYYIGNLGKWVTRYMIKTQIESHGLSATYVKVIPHKERKDCNGAKIVIKGDHSDTVLNKNFFPGDQVYVRKWIDYA